MDLHLRKLEQIQFVAVAVAVVLGIVEADLGTVVVVQDVFVDLGNCSCETVENVVVDAAVVVGYRGLEGAVFEVQVHPEERQVVAKAFLGEAGVDECSSVAYWAVQPCQGVGREGVLPGSRRAVVAFLEEAFHQVEEGNLEVEILA